MVKLLIVDDEAYIRDELKYLLKQIDGCEICGETGKSDEVIKLVKELKPDVVFLDIELRGVSGLSIARLIEGLENPPEIIISTAYDKYAIMGYELNVADYILKPFSLDRLKRALAKVKTRKKLNAINLKESLQEHPGDSNHNANRTNKIAVNTNGKILLLHLDKVVYFTSSGNGAEVFAENKSYSTNLSLKSLESIIPDKTFHRIHKSYIVNTDKIEEIIPWFNYTCKLKMIGVDEELLVSRSYYKVFKTRFSIS